MPLTLPKGSLVSLGGTDLSEHNRSTLELTPDESRKDYRLANASMRRMHVASKRKFSLSWEMLPARDTETVDGKAGRNTLRDLYDDNKGTLTFTYKEASGTTKHATTTTTNTVTVFIEGYQEELVKRFNAEYWNVSLSLVEQ